MTKRRARKKATKDRRIAVADFETDPFEVGVIPSPFVLGFYCEDEGYHYFWGENCADQFVNFLNTLDNPLLIYMHNGGKFDFFFLLKHAAGNIRMINSRIVEMQIGIHTFRDSYPAVPVPLSKIDKGEIDYDKMRTEVRDKHRDEILVYLERDCMSLFKLMSAFIATFGDKLTIGGAALAELRKLHKFDDMNEEHDALFRQFYFGGRVECFKGGILKGKFYVFDVNSMYPYIMAKYQHPTGRLYSRPVKPVLLENGDLQGYPGRFYFMIVEGYNRGALPMRQKTGLSFNVEYGVFYTTSHEMRAALKCGLFSPVKIHACHVCHETINFAAFVDKFMTEKIRCEEAGDIVGRTFAKLIQNNAYGKLAQNSREFCDYMIIDQDTDLPDGARINSIVMDKMLIEWDAPTGRFFDVATAASITSGARAYLLESLHVAKNPVYCDTDSIICEDLPLDLHATRLGAWKTEASGDLLGIGGKKLYALYDGDTLVKKASKGVRLSGEEIISVASGTEVVYANPVPTFSPKNFGKFITRTVARRI